MFSYRALLKQAWEICLKHKYLWFFGLFASLTAAGGSWEYQLLTQSPSLIDGSYERLSLVLALADLSKNFFQGFLGLFRYDFWTILNALSLILVAAILVCSFIWLAIASQSALVNDVKKILTAKKKEPKLSLREGLTDGKEHFWSVLALNFMIKIMVSFLFFLISLPLLLMVTTDSNILGTAYVMLFIVFVPIATGLSLLLKYAIAYRVLDNKSFVSSLEQAGRLFKKHWLISVEMAVILFLINFLASLAVLIVLCLFLLPLFVLALLSQVFWLIVTILLVAAIIVIVWGSLMTSFQTAAWTNLFLRLEDKGGLAKLERIFARS